MARYYSLKEQIIFTLIVIMALYFLVSSFSSSEMILEGTFLNKIHSKVLEKVLMIHTAE